MGGRRPAVAAGGGGGKGGGGGSVSSASCNWSLQSVLPGFIPACRAALTCCRRQPPPVLAPQLCSLCRLQLPGGPGYTLISAAGRRAGVARVWRRAKRRCSLYAACRVCVFSALSRCWQDAGDAVQAHAWRAAHGCGDGARAPGRGPAQTEYGVAANCAPVIASARMSKWLHGNLSGLAGAGDIVALGSCGRRSSSGLRCSSSLRHAHAPLLSPAHL